MAGMSYGGPVADLARGSGHAGGYRVPVETPEREVEVTGVGALEQAGRGLEHPQVLRPRPGVDVRGARPGRTALLNTSRWGPSVNTATSTRGDRCTCAPGMARAYDVQ